jgi:hypothetical protein
MTGLCRRATGAAVLVLLMAVFLGVPAATAGGNTKPRRPFVGTHGLFVRGKLGSYCVTRQTGDKGVGICVDTAAPDEPPKARLPVNPGDRIVMLFPHRRGISDRPAQLHLSLGRIEDGNLQTFSARIEAHKVRGHPRKWHARAPRQVARANVLDMFERFPAGDASYLVGLRRG